MTILSNLPEWIKFVLVLLAMFGIYSAFTAMQYSKVRKQVLQMQNSLKPGDTVLTQSGLYGTLESISKNTARLKIAENLVITIDRFSIKETAGKGQEEK